MMIEEISIASNVVVSGYLPVYLIEIPDTLRFPLFLDEKDYSNDSRKFRIEHYNTPDKKIYIQLASEI